MEFLLFFFAAIVICAVLGEILRKHFSRRRTTSKFMKEFDRWFYGDKK